MAGMVKARSTDHKYARREILILEVYSRLSPWRAGSLRCKDVANKQWEEVTAVCGMTNGISK
jgi:hypothetical protein